MKRSSVPFFAAQVCIVLPANSGLFDLPPSSHTNLK
jgi:hypothetical protein